MKIILTNAIVHLVICYFRKILIYFYMGNIKMYQKSQLLHCLHVDAPKNQVFRVFGIACWVLGDVTICVLVFLG